MFFVIRSQTIENTLYEISRQYLAGNLKKPQKIGHFHTYDLEIGITNYLDHAIEEPHRHSVVIEFQYVLNGWTKYIDIDTQEEHEFRTGDFFVITPGTEYAQKSKPGTRILFIKSQSVNDKELIDVDLNTAKWLADQLKTVRIDYFHVDDAPPANSIRPAAAVAVINENKVLLVRRDDNKQWTLPGGTLDFNESLPECAIRELKEETGLTVDLVEIVGTYTDPNIKISYSDGEVRREFTIVYLAKVQGDQVMLDAESSEYAWVHINDFSKYPMTSSQQRRLKDLAYYLKTGNKVMS